MQNIPQNNDQESILNRKCGRMAMSKTPTNSILKKVYLSVGVLVLLALVSSDWAMQAATAAQPVLGLKMTGLQPAQVGLADRVGQTVSTGQLLSGISVSLTNPGSATPDARLRLIVHDGVGRDLAPGDIKIDVLEGSSWVSIPLKPIDGGVMGAIGAEGSGHKEIVQRGGFAIPAKSNKLLQLRFMFRLPGVYQLVVTVSPDNGNTHLTQPLVVTLEAL